MAALIIDGKKIASHIQEEIKNEVVRRKNEKRQIPGLATVLVGDDPASQVYLRSKHRACELVGIRSYSRKLPESITQSELEGVIDELNQAKEIHGILIQLPLPGGLDEEKALNRISINKDVDGFHPVNIGRLAQKGRQPLFIPCTPSGILYLLKTVISNLEGKRAVVLGRSNIVGMPTALLLIRENATVTICHSRTRDLPKIVQEADILVAAIGKPEFVKGNWIKPGAVVIDVGVNRVEDATKERGYRLVGDVDFKEAVNAASAITPVPGGVGPMTIAMLLKNTLRAAGFRD